MKFSLALFTAMLLLSTSAYADALDSPKIKHGEYLVKHVAMCIECHTPRNAKGQFQQDKLLQGAPIPVNRPNWAKNWAVQSANIWGLNGWSKEDGIRFLQTGIRPDGTRAKLPMPQFRMSHDDAEAIVLYLKNAE